MKRFRILLALALILPGLLIATGCGKKVTREVDVSAGEYYTPDEFKTLDTEQRDEYCADLADELARLQEQTSKDNEVAVDAAATSNELRTKIDKVKGMLARQDAEYGPILDQIDYFESLPKQYTVVKGDCLWKISGKEEIYADPVYWPRIYRANTDQIKDPHWIYPNQVFAIPRECPDDELHHLVKRGECLWGIAGYERVYGNSYDWPKLYEANREQIKDADLIYPAQLLDVPR